MTERIGKAALTMWSPRRVVLSDRFHIDGSRLCSPCNEFIRRIDEDLDPRRRQTHGGRTRLLLLARHSLVQEERCAIQMKPGDAVKVPQQAGAQRTRVPADRSSCIGNDQHHRQSCTRIPVHRY